MIKRTVCIAAFLGWFSVAFGAGSGMDMLVLGDAASEKSHELEAEFSDVIEGGLGETARRFLPKDQEDWRGGSFTVTMKVDPDQQNYFTAKFWGNDICREDAESRLCLFIEDLQVGYRHLGDIDSLDIMQHKIPRYPGRFFYKTVPLPRHITKGKTSVEIRVEGQGGINGYAKKINDYQKNMTEPSRGVYCVYTHTDTCFVPAEDEVQGVPPTHIPVRKEPGVELIEQLKTELNECSDREMAKGGKKNVDSIQYLAYAYLTEWNTAYKNKQALERIVEAADEHYLEWKDDPKTIEGLRWVHKGPIGDAVRLVHQDLKPWLDQKIPGTSTVRRKGWADMLVASRTHNSLTEGRRSYSNQCMIKDVYTFYCDQAVRCIDPSKAWPKQTALLLLYEAMGLEPFSGSWDESGRPDWSQGKNKMLLTEQGLTKELGFVGYYGEIVSDFGVMIYEATKPAPDQEGDPRLKEQLIKMCRARAPFRYQLIDEKGYRSMNLEAIIGWRDWKYPGGPIYDQTNGRDGGSFDAAIATGDPVLMGYGQQMLEEHQFFAKLKERMDIRHTNSKTRLLAVPEQYAIIASLPPQEYRLPMTEGQPDFVFADIDDGVIAFKDRGTIFYVSLYWRARHAINNLSRVHCLTPYMERDSIVCIETEFDDSGKTYRVPDRTNAGFGRGSNEDWYRDQGMEQAMADEKQPIATVPRDDDSYDVGDEHPKAGKAQLYKMGYGPYFIAMNCDDKKTFQFEMPPAFIGSKDLVSGQVANAPKVNLKPGMTIVLCNDWQTEREKPARTKVEAYIPKTEAADEVDAL
jgi:hypothetical protein